MAAGAAAAVCGARIGSRIAKTGSARRAMVNSQDEVVDSFCNIFVHTQGTSHERLQRALMRVPQTNTGAKYSVNYPTKEDLHFMTKVADIDRNGEVSGQEACFAFRVWLCWKKLYPKISAMFNTLDADGNGTLDAVELEPYLVRLNDGEDVMPAEVLSVIGRADSNGDGSLDKHELTFATAVWYTDIDRKKLERKKMSAKLSRGSKHVAKVGQAGMKSGMRKTLQLCKRVIHGRSRDGEEDGDRNTDFLAEHLPKDRGSADEQDTLEEGESFSIGRPKREDNSFVSSVSSERSEVARSSTATPESQRASTRSEQSQRSSAASTGENQGSAASTSASSVKQHTGDDISKITKEGAGVGDLDEIVQAKLARDRDLLARSSAKSDKASTDLSSIGSTAATGGATGGFSHPPSEIDSLDRGYPLAPALFMINKSDKPDLMHDNFSPKMACKERL